jgi:hypothetical protein
MRTVWKFETARFIVRLEIEEDSPFTYDGDDEDGETQRMLDSGELVAFDSLVSVDLKGSGTIATDSLGGSVYYANAIDEFWTAHRDSDPMNRNCEAMRAAASAASPGVRAAIGHYFPDMVREACRQARKALCSAPRMRCAA